MRILYDWFCNVADRFRFEWYIEDFEQSTQLIYDNLEAFDYDYEKIVALLNQHIGKPSFAIIESPGLDSDYEFVGDGSYFMDKKAFKKIET